MSQEKKNRNKKLCKLLQEIGDREKNLGNIYKANAYRKAVASLEAHPHKIRSGAEAKKLPGIGVSIAKKIDEFLETGKIKTLEESKDESQTLSELTRVAGVGPATAKKLSEEGIKTIDDLEKNSEKLTHHQKVGLKYLKEFEKRIARDEVKKIGKRIKATLKNIDQRFVVKLCGSFRRGAVDCKDVDVLVTHPDYTSDEKTKLKKKLKLENLIAELKKTGLITDELSLGETKFSGVCRLSDDLPHRRIDVRYLAVDQFQCGLLYFTGSALFNQQMRSHAVDEGYILNEYSLRQVGTTGVPGEPIPVTTEQEIFEYINYPYKKPNERIL